MINNMKEELKNMLKNAIKVIKKDNNIKNIDKGIQYQSKLNNIRLNDNTLIIQNKPNEYMTFELSLDNQKINNINIYQDNEPLIHSTNMNKIENIDNVHALSIIYHCKEIIKDQKNKINSKNVVYLKNK